ncbi:myrosinase 1-like [Eupeodes corollae]|uniref:myrosinase 1-like n=1 Tax=Eupeodes corollae TaxID=290404 RepID=UPI00248FE16C|nr:myrosinase 1-like [Eupeodes corollae]
MKFLGLFLIGILSLSSILGEQEGCYVGAKGSLHFPTNFSFGVATSAYQIEGGWNADGKGVSIWDEFTHNKPHQITDGSNGDLADDSYHRFDDDLKLLKDLKVGHYRFSISWSRIFPNGDVSFKNQAGVDYYNDVIDKLLANGITPLVTIHHSNTPLEIQKRGGFTSSMIIDYFVDFATELFEMFGDRVKNWITFNEPWTICNLGYGIAVIPPLFNDSGLGDYVCIHNVLMAHGATYRVYKEKFFQKQGGKVGIALDTNYFNSTNSSDTVTFERAMQFNIGYLAHPIFSKDGGYPPVMVNDIARNSLEEGRFRSRLPTFDREWRDIIKGSADFLGLNYYRSNPLRKASGPVGTSPSFERDLNVESVLDLYTCNPEGLEGVLHWLRKEYNNPPMIITENGWRDDYGKIEDDDRIDFLKSHLQAVLNAVNDGCNVYGYTHWSLIDNFEWVFGFTNKFGLYAVNRTSPTLERYPKKSAHFYKMVISSRVSPNGIIV